MRWIAIALLISLPCAAARAQGDVELAKEYYDVGAKLFGRSDFEGALENFRKSLKLSGKLALHYNIARCYESLGRAREAIEAYETYLSAPKPKDAEIVRARIKNLQRRLKVVATSADSEQPADERPGEASGVMGPLGWGLVGGGAALLVTGAILGGLAAGKASEIEEASNAPQRRSFDDYEETEASGQALQTGQIVTLAVGGAAAAAGAVLLYLHMTRSGAGAGEQRQAWIAPTVSADAAGVSGGFSF